MERCRVTEDLNDHQREMDKLYENERGQSVLIERKVAELKRDKEMWEMVLEEVINDGGFLNIFKGLNDPSPISPTLHYSIQNLQLLTQNVFEKIAEDLV